MANIMYICGGYTIDYEKSSSGSPPTLLIWLGCRVNHSACVQFRLILIGVLYIYIFTRLQPCFHVAPPAIPTFGKAKRSDWPSKIALITTQSSVLPRRRGQRPKDYGIKNMNMPPPLPLVKCCSHVYLTAVQFEVPPSPSLPRRVSGERAQ